MLMERAFDVAIYSRPFMLGQDWGDDENVVNLKMVFFDVKCFCLIYIVSASFTPLPAFLNIIVYAKPSKRKECRI